MIHVDLYKHAQENIKSQHLVASIELLMEAWRGSSRSTGARET